MHAYIITRGHKPYTEMFINELQGKYLPFKFKGKDCLVQTGVRPIQLWEVIFPEEHKDIMLNTLFDATAKGKTQHKKHNKYLYALRKMLGIEPIPEYKTDQFMPISKANVEVVGVGIKKDRYTEHGEML